jgi:hypothetical protein
MPRKTLIPAKPLPDGLSPATRNSTTEKQFLPNPAIFAYTGQPPLFVNVHITNLISGENECDPVSCQPQLRYV